MAAELLRVPDLSGGSLPEIPKTPDESLDRLQNVDLALLFWVILFGFGGGLFALYYSNIGYIPDIKWEDSVVYLGALTIAGVFLFIIYFVLLFIPGWIWSEFLIHNEHLTCVLCQEGGKSNEPRHMRVLVIFGAPFALFLVCLHVILDLSSNLWVLVAALPLLLAVSSGMMRWLLLRSMEKTGSPSENLKWRSVALFAVSNLVSFISILLIRETLSSGPGELMLAVCTSIVTIVNLFVAITCKKELRTALIVMASAALLLLVLGDLLVSGEGNRLSARIMSNFGIGYDHPVTLILTEKGAAILDQYGVKVDRDSKGGEPKAREIEILSRLGSEYFLRSFQSRLRFSFPKDGVVSWAVEEPKPTAPIVRAKARVPLKSRTGH